MTAGGWELLNIRRPPARHAACRTRIFVCGDPTPGGRDPLPAGPFDLVTSAWALEHLPDPGRVVASAAARLRPEAPALAARLVDEARFATLDVLGDGAAASAIAARRFRAGIEAAS